MKNIIITLAAAMICITSCKKQPTPAPASVVHSEVITEADFNGSKATQVIRQNKKTGEGIEFDYDLIIKEISDNKYEASIKIHGLKLNGKKTDDADKMGVAAVTLSLSGTKDSKEKPLSVELTVKDVKELADKKVITFPVFEYNGNLAYEMIDVRSTISVAPSNVTVFGKSSFSFGQILFTFSDPSIDVSRTSWDIAEGITGAASIKGKVEGHEKASINTYTNFALFYNGTKGSEKCDVVESNTIFILPKGHTVKQEPKVSKVKIQDEYGYVVVTVSGDPAMMVKTLTYKPEPVSGKEQPVMKFVATHFNTQQGVQRFVSTQTWEQVYGKTAFNSSTTFGTVIGFVYGL
ncbi:MAG: hypothetical protein K9G49_01765 [Taibaiella sp.]|nr:hypothetical protein [Taibaiella sp.]